MAISQRDILEQFPRIIHKQDFEVITALYNLSDAEWGECEFTRQIQSLLINMEFFEEHTPYKFDKHFRETKDLTVKEVDCEFCFDEKRTIAFVENGVNVEIKRDKKGDFVFNNCHWCNHD